MSTERRRSIEIPGAPHKAPIPSGARIGNVVFSSAINGSDPSTGQIPDDGQAQVGFAFTNLRTFLDQAGVTAEDVVRMTVHLEDRSLRPALDEQWIALFPDPESRPARHAMNLPLNQNMLIQLEIVAVARDQEEG
ncbi:RidA family protein [Nocardia sp. NPDC004123]